jgi:outer membrane protein OmpA-like peptidoglycan-associated protein
VTLIGACSLLSLFCITSVAWADWGYQVTQKIKPGQRAKLSVVSPITLKRVTVKFTSPQAKRDITKRIAKLRSGKPHKISFKPPRGLSHWKVEIKGRSGQRDEQVIFEFDIHNVNPLQMSFLKHESDLKAGRLVFKSNQPLGQVELNAYDDEGELQWDETLQFKSRGTKYTVNFTPRDDTPRRVDVKVYDALGGWQGFKIVRWYAEVPHDDVLFASGSSKVTQNELPKIQHAIAQIQEEIKKFRRAMGNPDAQVDLQLYVAGYTDTVGDRKDNQRLSEERAKTIGGIFKRLGVTLSIRYAGFGEAGQLVKTGDATEEPRNRRAIYVIANHPPSGIFFPRQRWRSLR